MMRKIHFSVVLIEHEHEKLLGNQNDFVLCHIGAKI